MGKALDAAVIAADALEIPDGDIRTVRFSDRQVSAIITAFLDAAAADPDTMHVVATAIVERGMHWAGRRDGKAAILALKESVTPSRASSSPP